MAGRLHLQENEEENPVNVLYGDMIITKDGKFKTVDFENKIVDSEAELAIEITELTENITEKIEELFIPTHIFSELDDIEIQAGNSTAGTWTTIMFPVEFSGIPRVTANVADGNTDSIVSIANVTPTGFQAYVTQFSPTTRYASAASGGATDTAISVLAMRAISRTINWTAIYDGRNA